MRQPILAVLAIMALAGSATPAVSDPSPISRNLYDACGEIGDSMSTMGNSFSAGFCAGILEGFYWGSDLSSPPAWDIPKRTWSTDIARVYRNWMDAHPQFLDEHWKYTLLAALVEEFPADNPGQNTAVATVETRLGIDLTPGSE